MVMKSQEDEFKLTAKKLQQIRRMSLTLSTPPAHWSRQAQGRTKHRQLASRATFFLLVLFWVPDFGLQHGSDNTSVLLQPICMQVTLQENINRLLGHGWVTTTSPIHRAQHSCNLTSVPDSRCGPQGIEACA